MAKQGIPWRSPLILLVASALLLCRPADVAARAPATASLQSPPQAPAVADLTFQRLSTSQGLSHPRVTTILQDHSGFAWFGTTAGLNRYDGYTMQTLASDIEDPAVLRAILITALAQDQDGRMWIGSTVNGLAAYDPRTGRFTRFPPRAQGGDGPGTGDITSLLVDRSGALWVGTQSGGLSRRDPRSGQFTLLRHSPADPTSLSNDWVRALYEDRAGTLWVGTQGGGLDALDPATGKVTHFRHDPADPASLSSDRVQAVAEDRAGTLWVGTAGGGLNALDPATGKFTRFHNDPADPASLSDDTVTAIHEDRDGRLWVATANGLNRFDRATGHFTVYRHDPADPTSLPVNGILSLYEDASGLLWIATDGGGASYTQLYGWPFRRFINRVGEPASLAPGVVRGVAADPDGAVWVGTFGSGLNKLDPRTGQATHYRQDPDDPQSLSDDLVWAIRLDAAGTPWIGTNDGILNRFDRATGTFRRYTLGPPERSYPIYAIDIDPSGALWVGTFGGGLHRFDPASESVTGYTSDSATGQGLSNNLIRTVVVDHEGMVWAGTFGGGLNRLDPRTGRVTTYRNEPDNPGSLSSDNVSALLEDSSRTLWVGTGAGLNRLERSTGRFTRYMDEEALPNGIVQGIAEANGQLWISTLSGMSRFDPATGTFRNYATRGDILSEGFTGVSMTRAGDGTIYAGGFSGLVSFDPAAIRDAAFDPPVVFTDFRINNRPVAIGPESPLQQAINATTALTLWEGQRTFSIAFAALDYWSPEQARYRYKLEGVDRDWVEVGSRQRFVTYANLGPGTYTLHVRAAGRDGGWNGPERTLAITIPPFLWERGWFQLGGLAVFGTLGVGAFALNGYRARARQRRLEAQVALRTRELSARTQELEHANGRLEMEITERRRAEGAAQQSRDELATQLVVSQQITGMLELDPLLERVLEELARVEPFDGAAIYTVEGEELVVRAFRSTLIARRFQGVRLDPRRVSRFQTLLTTRQPMIVPDRTANPADMAYLDSLIGDTRSLRAWMGFPLIVKDQVIGVLILMHHEVGYYGPEAQARVQLFANQVALAIENARLYAQARTVAVSEERTRIAHDLHDAVSQTLFSASLIAEALPNAVDHSPEHARRGAEELQQLTRGALSEMRMLLYELRPAAFSEKPLKELLRSLCTAVASRMRARLMFTFEEPCALQPGVVQTVFYRAVQEALNNVWKHAEATAVTVRASSTTDLVEVEVTDNGKGFDLGDFRDGDNALGMLRERAAAIGAVLHVVSQPGEGTTVRLSWRPSDNGDQPLKEERPAQGSQVHETIQPHH